MKYNSVMKVFTVYKHESKGYEAVKVGFSWPAFILSGWWMLVKGFIFVLIFYIAVGVLGTSYYNDMDMNAPYNANDFFVFVISLILWFYPGFYGNSWLHKKYKNKGYTELKTIPASSKEAAIAIAKNDEKESVSDIKFEKNIEEDSELFYEKAYSVAYEEIKDYEQYNDVEYIQNSDFWARAFAQSDGDEKKQKVIYVKLRAKELDKEYEKKLTKDYNKQKNKNDVMLIAVIIIALAIVIGIASST